MAETGDDDDDGDDFNCGEGGEGGDDYKGGEGGEGGDGDDGHEGSRLCSVSGTNSSSSSWPKQLFQWRPPTIVTNNLLFVMAVTNYLLQLQLLKSAAAATAAVPVMTCNSWNKSLVFVVGLIFIWWWVGLFERESESAEDIDIRKLLQCLFYQTRSPALLYERESDHAVDAFP